MSVRLLVIDDEAIIRDIWGEMFSYDDDYTVDVAESGEKGILKLKKGDYDIIVTDLNMPGINGIEVVKEAKKIKPETEIIIMTAFGTVEHAVEAIKRGAYDFVLKPLDFERIKFVLKKCNKQLEFKRENKDLKEVTQKLKELNEEKEKFITITSHELRTPINAISGLSEIIYDSLPEKIRGNLDKEFDILIASCNKLKEIVEEMYDLSIARSGGLKLNKFEFEIDNLEKKIMMSYNMFARNRSLGFKLKNVLKGRKFVGDLRRINQAVEKLVQNAVKYTRDGGNVNIRIDNESNDTSKYFTIEVSDTGIGIPPDQVEKIFEAFYEVQDTSKHHSSKTEFMGGGIGIGLSIVNEIAYAHSGKVTVESEVSKGSMFKLYLPYK